MKARHTLFAAGSTVTLVAGGIFFSAAPASANHNSPDCLAAQSQFTAALHTVELNADLEVELAVALQNLVDAQETLDLLEAEATLTLEELELLVADALVKVKDENLPNINAIINAEGGLNSAVGQAQLLLDAALAGSELDAAALLELGIDIEDFLFAAIDVDALDAALKIAVAANLLTQVEAEEILADVKEDGVLVQTSIDLLTVAGIEVVLLEPELDRVELAAAIQVVLDTLTLELATATELAALLETGDLSAILDAEAQLEALLGVDLDFSALINLEAQLFAALAVLDAQADLDAAIAVIDGLLVKLDALDVDLLEVEALFEAAIKACAGVDPIDGGNNDNDNDHDYGNGAVGGGGTTGGAVTTGNTNRGMNVQTAVPTASTDPAGIGALAAGIGFMVAAGTVVARRVRHS